MRIACWNVNGYRAICNKGYDDWFRKIDADVVGLQEVKGHLEAVNPKLIERDGYQCFWHAAKKPGYSGVAVWTRVEPLSYQEGIGIKKIDDEGRVQILEFKNFFFLNCYFPNSQDERARLPYKLEFNDAILDFAKKVQKKGKSIIIQGDFNVAHTELDIKNAKANENTAGFYIEERESFTKMLNQGNLSDLYREWHPGKAGLYTWWSYRMKARERNVGWRIDYQILNNEFTDRVKNMDHQRDVMGSDHCPIWLELKP